MNCLKSGNLRLATCLLALFFVVAGSVSLAQVGASISGRIDDPSGAAVPGVNVRVTSLETGAVRTVVTDEGGRYQALSLPVGQYEVKAEATGFKIAAQTGIRLVVGQQAVVNLQLEVGSVQEQMTVTSDAPLVNTTTFSVAGLVGETQVKDLPINGRSFDLLITLNPGTINYTANKSGTGGNLYAGGNLFSVSGRRPSENLTLLNGVQYSGAGAAFNTPGGASGQLLGVDAVREYNVVSNEYGAEYGKRAGAQMSMVTQSGTNQLHGTLFEFLRNNKLDARNYFDYPVRPPFKRNQFGGALGGPIRKDKTFIFGNYEGFRERLGLSLVSFVPDLNARKGILPCGTSGSTCPTGVAAGTPITVPNLDPRMLRYMDMWLLPNGANLGGGVAENFSNPVQSLREDFGTARFDHMFSEKDSLSGVYTISDGNNINPGANPLFGFGITIRNQVASLQETHIFSPNVVNTFTAGFTRANYLTETSTAIPFADDLSFVSGYTPGQITTSGTTSGGTITPPGNQNPFGRFKRNLFTYTDGLQVIKGRHQISAGVWFQRIQQNDLHALRGSGQATFDTFALFLQATVREFSVAPRSVPNGWRSLTGAWYLQDSIQLRPNLNLRVGLRHEFSNGWSEVNGKAQTPLFVNGVMQTVPRISNNLLTENNSKLLFSPRVAIAWDPFGKGKTSIRAGYGTYYNLMDWLPYFVDNTPPLNGLVTYNNVSLFSVIPVDRSADIPQCGPNVTGRCNVYGPRGIASDYKIPTVQSWSFRVEQQLTQGIAVRLGYVGSRGYHNPMNIDPNSILSQICSNPAGCVSGGVNAPRGNVPQGAQYIPVGSRPNPNLGSGFFQVNHGIASYHSLQTELVQRLTHGLTFRVNYTLARNMDTASTWQNMEGANTTAGMLDRADFRRNYARAAFDIRHQVTGNFTYALPFGQGKAWLGGAHGVMGKLVSGWQLNGIVTLLSGQPFDVTVGNNRSGNGDTQAPDRPNWNPAFTGTLMPGTQVQWFNPNAFSLPTAGTFGNVGRNVLQGPGLAIADLSLFKTTKISERVGLQFRVEAFNAFNHTNFSFPTKNVFNGTNINPTGGRITSTATTSRQFQLGLKLVF